uniref:SAM domain-containing protein n=1 Tax=Photinus pyralis TaxID=7054 RepID=A0A1Y1MM07_PHOPY
MINKLFSEDIDTRSGPVPPPPPPPMPTVETIQLNDIPNTEPIIRPPLKRSPSIMSTMTTTSERMQDELNIVLSMFRDNKSKNYDITQTPEIYIDQRSTPSEVQEWLQAKMFSAEICAKFKKTSGYQLLGLSYDQLEKICGPIEGKRLESQINVQKGVSGYQTMGRSELQAVLAKARKKIESNS